MQFGWIQLFSFIFLDSEYIIPSYLFFCHPAYISMTTSPCHGRFRARAIYLEGIGFINLFFYDDIYDDMLPYPAKEMSCVSFLIPFGARSAMSVLDCGKPITRMYCSCRGKHMWCEERTRRLKLGCPVYHLFHSPSWARQALELVVRSALLKSNPKTACNPKGGVITMSSSGTQRWQPKQPWVLCKCLHTSHAIISLNGGIAAIMRKTKRDLSQKLILDMNWWVLVNIMFIWCRNL